MKLRGLLLFGLAALVASCANDTCLQGDCVTPCASLQPSCDASQQRPLYVGPVAQAPAELQLLGGNAGQRDLLISNGYITAVISAVDTPNDLAPTGGNLIDFGTVGSVDDVTLIYQLAGILPDDALAYDELTIEDQRPAFVAIKAKGTLDGRRDVKVVTRYELRPCDQGLRVWTELFNGSVDSQGFTLADSSHWGKRRFAPFTPLAGQGFLAPKLDLIELTALWHPAPYVAAITPNGQSSGLGMLACNNRHVYGVNDLEISALGTPLQVVAPGATLLFERMWFATAPARGAGAAVDQLLSARSSLFGEAAGPMITGRVLADGMPFGGDVRRASLVVYAQAAGKRQPVTSVVPDADGNFAVATPAGGPYQLELSSFGTVRQTVDVPTDGAVGDLQLPLPATVNLAVVGQLQTGPVPIFATVVVVPADAATAAATTGDFHGRFGSCAPWLGPPNGASPACNRVVVEPRGVDVEIPAGNYHVLASAGPAYQLAKQTVTLQAGEVSALAFNLTPLPLTPSGWLSADLHVHGRASFDSGLPDADRVRSFVANGVDVIAATDHDVIADYAMTVAALGVGDKVAVMGGLETTQLIPWLDLPDEDLPKVIGHFNFWPLVPTPGEPFGGAPWDERMEPGELFDQMAPRLRGTGVMQMNHPWDEPFFGRDLGYLRAIGFDPRLPIVDDGSPNANLLRRPGNNHRNGDWHTVEIINGADSAESQKARTLWHALLARGWVSTGTGNSDSHSLSDAQLGWARNWVRTDTTVATFHADAFNAALRDGQVSTGNGVMVTVEVVPASGPRRGLGFTPHVQQAGDMLHIEVRAAPWVPVTEVRLVTSDGTAVLAAGAALITPGDPFGTDGVLRYAADIPLALAHDDFVIVEAGLPWVPAADLDDDGVEDTTDNNGDGQVDASDIEPDEDSGPWTPPADPTNDQDPRFWLTRVVPQAWPHGFTNPILIDVDGNGWQAPLAATGGDL